MPVALPAAPVGGDMKFLSRVEYNAEAGRFFDAQRIKDGDNWTSQKRDLKSARLPIAFLADLRNLETGWACLSVTPPQFYGFGNYTQPMPPQPPSPGGLNKYGKPTQFVFAMRVLLYSKKLFGTDEPVREMTMLNRTAQEGLNEVLANAEVQEEWGNPDLLPLIECVEEIPVKVGQKTLYRPAFVINAWHPRPADFVFTPKDDSGPAPSAAPPASVSGQGVYRPDQGARSPMATGLPQRAAPSGRDLDDAIPF